MNNGTINILGAFENNLKHIDVQIPKNAITVVTGVSGSGKSSLVIDTLVRAAQAQFFDTLSYREREFFSLGSKVKVEKIEGLSPVIFLSQREQNPSLRASVATHTRLGELLGLWLAKFGEYFCPDHNQPTTAQTPEKLLETLFAKHAGELLLLTAPIVKEQKGKLDRELAQYIEKGYLRIVLNGEVFSLTPKPYISPDKKHSLNLVIDYVSVKPTNSSRLLRSIELALKEGEGFLEYFILDAAKNIQSSSFTFTGRHGCGVCGYHWRKMDLRHFLPQALGGCEICKGRAILAEGVGCSVCFGTGLCANLAFVRSQGVSLFDFYRMSLHELREHFQVLPKASQDAAALRIHTEIVKTLEKIAQSGLGYLSLSRRLTTLADGELARLKLVSLVAEGLYGILYVLDEPSQGLHPKEVFSLVQSLRALIAKGNTIVVVDHNRFLAQSADWLLELGPGGGSQGGKLLYEGPPKKDPEQRMLSLLPEADTNQEKFWLLDCYANNLKIDRVAFRYQSLNIVVGVSGAGKSTLVLDCLLSKAQQGLGEFDSILVIDRASLARSKTSMLATFLGVFSSIRDLFASLPQAKLLGLTAQAFSLRLVAGRCQACNGQGSFLIRMKFLSDAEVTCSSCLGKRYKGEVLGVRYKELNIAEVLGLSISDALQFFAAHRQICRLLQEAQDLGLGYLTLGQSLFSLSGGEAQRLKLLPFMREAAFKKALVILDEPCRGLHAQDVERLLIAINRLTSRGYTFVVIEHHLTFIQAGQWFIELGPGAGKEGGQLLVAGDYQAFLSSSASVTASFIAKIP